MKIISCIIPTYGRPSSVIEDTISSIIKYTDETPSYIYEIFLIDQNTEPLNLSSIKNIEYIKINCNTTINCATKRQLIHITGLDPSVTKAKNHALKLANGEKLFFFDDDVLLQKGTLKAFSETLDNTPNMGALGAREIVMPETLERSKLKNLLAKFSEIFAPKSKDEEKYKINTQYVGRVSPKSLFYCNFKQESPNLIQVNTVRGCGWACKASVLKQVGFFDEFFSGTALREETDLYLRIQKAGFINYYTSNATIHHMRQLGGCNNLYKSIASLNSKLKNEAYFQATHFAQVSLFFFALRTLPICLVEIKNTKGLSLVSYFRNLKYFLKLRNN